MTKKKTRAVSEASEQRAEAAPVPQKTEETPFEAVASICSVLVVGLYILTFLAQNFVIPSGSMEKTLLVGDHLVVDRITLAPPSRWMPLERYREPRRGDIVVFIKPVAEPQLDADGNPQYFFLVKRLIGVPGDHIHLRDGIVYINGVAQPAPKEGSSDPGSPMDEIFLDEFPSIPPAQAPSGAATEGWAVDEPNHVVDGDLVVPAGHVLHDGRQPAQQPGLALLGLCSAAEHRRPAAVQLLVVRIHRSRLRANRDGPALARMVHVVTHFFTETRWSRTLHLTR